MNIHKIATYILVVLTGMMVATFAAYYLLNQFVYPAKISEIQGDAEADIQTPTETETSPEIQ